MVSKIAVGALVGVATVSAVYTSRSAQSSEVPTAVPSATVSSAAPTPAEESPTPTATATQAPTVSETSSASASIAGPVPIPVATPTASNRNLVGGTVGVVTRVVDGDTIWVGKAKIRIIGIDTPERGRCGFGPATSNMRRLVEGKRVTLTPGAREDKDRYGRLLRYVDVNGIDAGREQIRVSLAIARYDSRDGYGKHARESDYVKLDASNPAPCSQYKTPVPTTTPAPNALVNNGSEMGSTTYYASCADARAAGAAPLHEGDPGYRAKLDRDRDGVACE